MNKENSPNNNFTGSRVVMIEPLQQRVDYLERRIEELQVSYGNRFVDLDHDLYNVMKLVKKLTEEKQDEQSK